MDSKQAWKQHLPVRAGLFGALRFEAGACSFTHLLTHSEKMAGLLAYLMIHAGRSISVRELLEAIWPESSSSSPENALKMQVYRLRTVLQKAGLPFYKECITTERGGYRWNTDIPFYVDVVEFERSARKAANNALPGEHRAALLRQAVSLYRGEFLEFCAGQNWIAPLAAYYRLLYRQSVVMLVGLLQEMQQFADITDICRRAIAVEPLEEELHASLLQALAYQGRGKDVREHYERLEKLFDDQLGTPPSDQLRELYQKITDTTLQTTASMLSILQDLRDAHVAEGVLLCDYPLFRHVYRLQSRIALRNGVSMSVVLLTLTGEGGEPPSQQMLEEAMRTIVALCRVHLRNTDLLAHYSANQYLLLLPTKGRAAEAAVRRLCAVFNRGRARRPLTLRYVISPVEPAELPKQFAEQAGRY